MRQSAGILVLVVAATAACGRKGPPLPPLVRIPAAPADIVAERRGSQVDIRFTVPAANTDGSRPANIQRVDIYAVDDPVPPSDAELVKKGTRIAAVDVKSPRDPNATVEADDADADLDPLEGRGLDQGAAARVEDRLGSANAGTAAPAVRTYVGVAVNKRGRPVSISKRVAVPLGPAPAAPATPLIEYDEVQVTIRWEPPASVDGVSFFVYDKPEKGTPSRLNQTPVKETAFVDSRKDRIVWGMQRCFAVTAVRAADALVVESDPSPLGCVTLADTFPPKAPTGLQTVPSDRVVSLIWNENTEPDLVGYLVLRGADGDAALTPLTPAPIPDPHFEDSTAEPGRMLLYAVKAVDKAGNASPESARVSGAAR